MEETRGAPAARIHVSATQIFLANGQRPIVAARLGRAFVSLSLLTLGGGMEVFPELKSHAVDVRGWLTAPQLDYLYSVGQLAPGPNMLMMASIGERVAGAAGATNRVWTEMRDCFCPRAYRIPR